MIFLIPNFNKLSAYSCTNINYFIDFIHYFIYFINYFINQFYSRMRLVKFWISSPEIPNCSRRLLYCRECVARLRNTAELTNRSDFRANLSVLQRGLHKQRIDEREHGLLDIAVSAFNAGYCEDAH